MVYYLSLFYDIFQTTYLKKFIHSNREVNLKEEFVLTFMYVFKYILGGKHLAKSDLLWTYIGSKYLLLNFQDLQHIISITCNYVDCCLTFLGKVFIDLRSPGGDGRWQQRRRRLRGRPSLSSKGFSFFEEIWNKRETYCKSCIALCRSSVLSTFNFGVYWVETYENKHWL